MRTSYLVVSVIVAMLAVVLGAGMHGDETAERNPDRLRALYSIEPPYAFIDGDGRVSGEAPELLRLAAQRAGFAEVDFIHAEFSHLMHDLALGRADVIASGLFSTSERARRVAFTRPTARVSAALLVMSGNPRGIRSLADVVRQSDVVLAVVDGAIESAVARRAGVPAERIQRHGDAMSAAIAVIEGRADVLALSDVSLNYLVQVAGLSGVEVVRLQTGTGRDAGVGDGMPAFAVRVGDEALRRRLDAALEQILGGEEHRALIGRFGFSEANLPGPAK
ncbi:transporter substrate-binding domain-containing protein [Methyloversatilis thermotolerans]|uniref:transporter substrate-binding domain-containing protein n=1 Tax=Methyloversatilis thermotolerans TaxID=1346290 RepID=UPI0003A65A21|nr:transporter substrate-binding domain-containing protein [Methyloversatilis thermotolerans]